MKQETMRPVVAAYRITYGSLTRGKDFGANGYDFSREDTEARTAAFEVACALESPTSKARKADLGMAVDDLLDAET